jgi:hypothetical protein
MFSGPLAVWNIYGEDRIPFKLFSEYIANYNLANKKTLPCGASRTEAPTVMMHALRALNRQITDLDSSLAEPGAEFIDGLGWTKGGLIRIERPALDAAAEEEAPPSLIGIRRGRKKLF